MVASLGPLAPAGWSAAAAIGISQEPQAGEPSGLNSMAAYAGQIVQSIELPNVPNAAHLLQMVPQKVGEPLDRDQVRESIRVLFATGRFSDIQAEVRPIGSGVVL